MPVQSTNSVTSATPNLQDMSPEEQRALLARLLRQRATQDKSFPMSAGQQGLWHAYRRDPQATEFNVFLPTRIKSSVDVGAFTRSIQLLAARHASLRTTFSDRDGALLQTIHDALVPELRVVDLPSASDAEIQREIETEVARPFDLESGPLLKVVLYRISESDWVVLALTHHIVVDFWSLVLILNELRVAYPSFVANVDPGLRPATNNYSQFVREQTALLASDQGQQLRKSWERVVVGGSPVLEIPIDSIRPSQFSNQASVVPVAIPQELVARITRFSNDNRSTSFATVHSALQVMLGRYSGQNSFFIGSPFSGRRHQKYENTVGFFVNMLPLPANLEGDPTFRELLKRTSRGLFEALENEAYPISQIVHDATLHRDPSRSPLFQVSCTFEKAQVKEELGRAGFLFPDTPQVWEFGGLKQESFYVPHPTCHYDLEFIFEQTDDDLRGMICYCRDLFDEATAEAMADNFVTLLDSLVAQSSQPISSIPWVRSEKRSRRVATRSRDVKQFDQTVDAMLATAAGANPEGVALKYGNVELSYSQLMARSWELAERMQQHSLGADSLVPIVASRGPNAWVAMLATHLAGAAFVPVDVEQSMLPLAELVADTRATLVLSERPEDLDDLGGAHVLPIDVSTTRLASTGAPRARPEDLSYVVYTSGSTGKPKGVLIEHRAVCSTLHWRMRDVPLRHDDRVLMLLSHQFDAGLGIAWTTLTQGAQLVWANSATLPDRPSMIDPAQLIEQIIRDEITVLPAVPSLLRLIIAHPRFTECKSLRYIWTGGEAMPPDLPQQIRSLSNARFWNFYGPTESAIEATACEVTDHPPHRPIPIGRAIAGTEILVLDEHRRPVPTTVPGEIAIAGQGLARGYLNQTDLTQAAFVPHPNQSPGERVYLTGDRGRINAHGDVEFLGRTDHQVKLRGYRIELGEIESLLESHAWIDRAAVKLINEGSSAQLVAYVNLDVAQASLSAKQGAQLNATLRRFLAAELAAYKVPQSIQVLPHMPLTSSGKVDRKRLPEEVSTANLALEILEPTTPIEEFLAKIWCDVLGLERVGVNQNFFDAGGSSLQAALLTSRLSDELEVNVPTALIFDLADISEVALRLAELHPDLMAQRFGQAAVAKQLEAHSVSRRPNGSSGWHDLLAPLQPQGTARPLFMVHPPGGIVTCYRELAQEMGGEQPFFAIRSRGLYGSEDLPDSLEQMAADYVQAIQSVQTSGPYLLGGWSLGGLVAYEVARQLIDAGERVERMLLLDTTIPEGATSLVPKSEQVNVGLEYGIDLSLDELGDLSPEEQLPFLWEHAKKLGVLDDDTPPEVVAKSLSDLQGLFHHHVELCSRYQLQPLEVPVTLFRPQDVPFDLPVAEDRGWGHLVRHVEVRFVPGHHHSMVQSPHVATLASELSKVTCETGHEPQE